MNILKSEPALISALVTAILTLLVAFRVDVTAEQSAAIIGVVSVVLHLVVRSQVTPKAG